MRRDLSTRTKMSLVAVFTSLKANVSLSMRFGWKAVPQLRSCSCKTHVSIVAVGSSDNTRPWCGRTQLTTTWYHHCNVNYIRHIHCIQYSSGSNDIDKSTHKQSFKCGTNVEIASNNTAVVRICVAAYTVSIITARCPQVVTAYYSSVPLSLTGWRPGDKMRMNLPESVAHTTATNDLTLARWSIPDTL